MPLLATPTAGKQFNGFPGDIWALGVCLFMFVFGKPPFTGATTYQIYEAIQQGELVFPPELPVSGELMVRRGYGSARCLQHDIRRGRRQRGLSEARLVDAQRMHPRFAMSTDRATGRG